MKEKLIEILKIALNSADSKISHAPAHVQILEYDIDFNFYIISVLHRENGGEITLRERQPLGSPDFVGSSDLEYVESKHLYEMCVEYERKKRNNIVKQDEPRVDLILQKLKK